MMHPSIRHVEEMSPEGRSKCTDRTMFTLHVKLYLSNLARTIDMMGESIDAA